MCVYFHSFGPSFTISCVLLESLGILTPSFKKIFLYLLIPSISSGNLLTFIYLDLAVIVTHFVLLLAVLTPLSFPSLTDALESDSRFSISTPIIILSFILHVGDTANILSVPCPPLLQWSFLRHHLSHSLRFPDFVMMDN